MMSDGNETSIDQLLDSTSFIYARLLKGVGGFYEFCPIFSPVFEDLA